MSSTVTLRRLFQSISGAFYDGALPSDVNVEDGRLPRDRIGEWDPRTRRLRVDMRRSPNWLETITHEIAHVRTPELITPASWHGEPFERERLSLLGRVLNAVKRREKKSGRRPPDTKLPKLRDLPKETPMLFHVNRREIAAPDQYTGTQTLRRIRDFERALEARIPGATRWIAGYQPFVDVRGHWQPGATLRDRLGALTVREAREKSAKRKLAERSATR